MKEIKYVLTDEVGIHARPAGELAKIVKEFESTVMIILGDKSAKAKSLMKVMGLGAKQGDEIIVQVEGADEEACAAKLEAFLKENL